MQKTCFEAVNFNENLFPTAVTLQKLGYEGIEIAIRDPDIVEKEKIHEVLKKTGLVVPAVGTGQAFIEEKLSLSSLNPRIRKRAIERVKKHVALSSSFGSLVIIGLIRGHLPQEEGKKEKALELLKDSLRECSEFAQSKNVKLVIEPLNRYELNFLNTLEETAAFVSSLGMPNVGILADSFHMNIEERDFQKSLLNVKNLLWHFHVADSNRWAPGFGHLDFGTILKTLQEIGYQGFISAEIFQKPDFHRAAEQTITHLRKWISGKD
ncbi:MAG: 5-keto-L-gluconate epimerase [Candidatus Caldatribacteriaceae bacterium]